MCGIVGFLDKTDNRQAPVGQTLLDMLSALARRGPDSSGVALYGDYGSDQYVVRVKLGEQGPFDTIASHVIEQVNGVGSVLDSGLQGPSLRLVVASQENAAQLEQTIEAVGAATGGIEWTVLAELDAHNVAVTAVIPIQRHSA